jgi:hypothetical protein
MFPTFWGRQILALPPHLVAVRRLTGGRVRSAISARRLTRAVLLLAVWSPPLFGCASEPTVSASAAQIPPVPPGLARVWVLRQFEPGLGIQWAPITFVNGATLAPSYAGTAFYRDVPAGTYAFTVASCTRDFNQGQTLQLAAGMQADLQVQALTDFGSWGCFDPNTWYIRQIAPERA